MSHRHSVSRSGSARYFAIVAACTAALFAGCSANTEGDDNATGGQVTSLGGHSSTAGGANSTLTGGKNATGGNKNTGGTKPAATTGASCTPAMNGQQGCACLDPLTTDGGPTCYSGTCSIVKLVCCSTLGDCSIKPSTGTGGTSSSGGKTGAGGVTSNLGGSHAGGTTNDAGPDEDAGFEEDASAGGHLAVGGHSSIVGTSGTGGTGTAATGGVWSSGGVPSTGGAGGMGGITAAGGTGSVVSCTLGTEQCGCFQNQCFSPWECYSDLCVDPNSLIYTGSGTGINTSCSGTAGCNCYGNHTCNDGLKCMSNLCVAETAADAGVDAGN